MAVVEEMEVVAIQVEWVLMEWMLHNLILEQMVGQEGLVETAEMQLVDLMEDQEDL